MGRETSNIKKRLIVSYNNLSPELQEELRKQYPLGFTDSMQRYDKKEPGDFFYAVTLDTPDITYLVKIDVKIDDDPEDDDKGFYDEDEIKGAEEIATDEEEGDDDNE
jgi:hypothetical protein